MKRTNVHLSEQQIAALRQLQLATGITTAEHIRRAIDAYLEIQRGALSQREKPSRM